MLKRTVFSLGVLGLFLVRPTQTETGYVHCDSRSDVPVYSAPGSLAASGTLACGQEVTVLGKENAYRKVVLPGGTTGYALSHFIREEAVSSQPEPAAVPQPVSTQTDSRSSNKSGGSFWKKLAAGVAVGALITASAYAAWADTTYNPPSYQPAGQSTETAVVSPSLSTTRPQYYSPQSVQLPYTHSASSQRTAPLAPVTGSFNFLGSEISVYGQDRNYLGNLGNKYDPDSINNPYGRYGSKYSPDSVNNPYGQYGSRYSPLSARNPYTTQAPILVDSNGQYLGRLSNNRYDPDSTGNRFGRYGSKFSPDSINNPFRMK